MSLPQLQNLRCLVSKSVSKDWQSAKKLIYPFWFWFKRLSLESDMSNCPDRKWPHGLNPHLSWPVSNPLLGLSLYLNIPSSPQLHSSYTSECNWQVSVRPSWERQVVLQDHPLGSSAYTVSSVCMARGQTSQSGPAGLKHLPHESEQLCLHGLGGASASQGFKQSKGKVQKKSQVWFIWEQI